MMEALTGYLEVIEDAGTLAQLGFGLLSSIIATYVFRLLINGPILRRIEGSKNLYDDRIFTLATPLLNLGVLLCGIWLTFQWSFEDGSFERSAFAGGSMAVLLVMAAQFLTALVDDFVPPIFQEIDERTHLDLSTMQTITVSAAKMVAWLAAVLIALEQLNIDVTPILASATILTLVVGLALQETAGNLVSGMLMLLDKPFSKGDKVIVKGVKGKVVDVGLMTTKIRTGNERLVVIPNTSLSGEVVENYAQGSTLENPDSMNLRFRVRTGLDEDAELVKEIMMKAVTDCEFTVDYVKTEVLLYDITETALVFRLDCWVNDYNNERKAKDWILIEILRKFKEEGISIPYPHLTVKNQD
jgi:small-conductance mechanosensitive channel